MKTTEDVLKPGLYVSLCCGCKQSFEHHQVFQRCPSCHELCGWEVSEEPMDKKRTMNALRHVLSEQ
jgi:hypothetical protein